MTLVVTFITCIIILSVDVVADKNLPYAVKEFEAVNRDIACAEIGLFIRAELSHSSHMWQRKFNVKTLL
jgi:hypothetical protein